MKKLIIGNGEYATVYKVTTDCGSYAVKIFHPNEELQQSAQNEIDIFNKIQSRSPYIIEMFGYNIGPTCSITLEYANGGNLKEYINGWSLWLRTQMYQQFGYEHLLLLEKLHFILDIAKGLSTLHQLGIIHRDIKPQNIVLHNTLSGYKAMICDFGTASAHAKEATVEIKETDPNNPLYYGCVSSPTYAAPEVLNPQRRAYYSDASDIYALAILAYGLLSGNLNYYHVTHHLNNLLDLLSRHKDHLRPDLTTVSVSTPVKKVLSEMWHKKHTNRPNANNVIEKIEGLITQNNFALYT